MVYHNQLAHIALYSLAVTAAEAAEGAGDTVPRAIYTSCRFVTAHYEDKGSESQDIRQVSSAGVHAKGY